MSDGIGYLIPDNSQPNELDCVRVYYPRDPMYLRALIGSLSYLGTWTAWERDPEKRGRLAAIAWKDANDKTFDDLHLGCGEDCPECEECPEGCELCDMTKDELAEIIQQELENMSIVINNCNHGCGCGGCGCSGPGGGADLTPPPITPTDPVEWPGSGDIPGTNQSNVQRCNMANYLVYSLRLTLMRTIEHSGDMAEYNNAFEALWAGIKEHVEDWITQFSYGVFSWFMDSLNGNQTAAGWVADLFDTHFNYLVCQLFSSSNEGEAYLNLHNALGGTIADSDLAAIAQSIAEHLPYQLLFADTGSITIPAGFDNRECCGQTPIDNLLGVWKVEVSGSPDYYSSACNGVSIVTETENIPLSFKADFSLARTDTYTDYECTIYRDSPIGDADAFVIFLEQSGDMREWEVRFVDGSGGVVHSQSLGSGALMTHAFASSAFDFTAVSRVEIVRDGENYTTDCPRLFDVALSIATGSDDWMEY